VFQRTWFRGTRVLDQSFRTLSCDSVVKPLPFDKPTEINSYLSSPESDSSGSNLLQLGPFLYWPDGCLSLDSPCFPLVLALRLNQSKMSLLTARLVFRCSRFNSLREEFVDQLSHCWKFRNDQLGFKRLLVSEEVMSSDLQLSYRMVSVSFGVTGLHSSLLGCFFLYSCPTDIPFRLPFRPWIDTLFPLCWAKFLNLRRSSDL